MPLSEISPNVRKHAGRSQGLHSSQKTLSSNPAATSFATDAVQSMLRTTTETGDIGLFSVRSSRLPSSASRIQSSHRRSGSFDSSFATGLPHQRLRRLQGKAQRSNGPRQMPSFLNLSRQDTVRSNLTSYNQNPRSRQRSTRPYHRGFEGTTSPSSGPHRLYTHRSLVTLRSQRDFASVGSNSPRAYRGRFQGPGHRAASPAHSETSRYGYNFRPQYHGTASVGTAASSPASNYPRSRGWPDYLPHIDSSVATLATLPSPTVYPPCHGPLRSPFPSRTNTPVSTSLQHSHSSTHARPGSGHALQRSPTASSIPAYYDYTESFVEEDCFSLDIETSTSSLPFIIDQTILENEPAPIFRRAQTPFGTLPGSPFLPAELPTPHNRTSKHSGVKPTTDVPSRLSSLGFSLPSRQTEAEQSKVSLVELQGSEAAQQREDDDLRRSSGISRRSCSSSASISFFPNANRSPRDLTRLAARAHAPTPEDIPQRILSLDSTLARPGEGDSSAILKGDNWQLASLNFRPLSFICAQVASDRPRTTEAIISKESIEILSPAPERPVSSQSRQQFHRILGLEDDGLDKMSTVFKAYSSNNLGKLRRVVELAENHHSSRLSIPPYSPRKSAFEKSPDENDVPGGATNHEARLSQTTSNDKSTVESLLDKHIDCLGLQPATSELEFHAGTEHTNTACGRSTCRNEDTVKLSKPICHQESLDSVRPFTASSAYPSTLASPECELLVPKLFSNKFYSIARSEAFRLSSVRSLPCMSEGATIDQNSGRPSTGWHTLASTTQLPSSPSPPHILQLQPKDCAERRSPEPLKYKLRRLSGMSISPLLTSSECRPSDGLYDGDDEAAVRRRLQDTLLVRQASHRRKIRARLKLKRNSLSQSKLGPADLSSPPDSFSTAQSPSQADLPSCQSHVQSTLEHVNLDRKEVHAMPEQGDASILKMKHDLYHESNCLPDIPRRSSSIVAITPKMVPSDMDMYRETSMRTGRPHRSNKSLPKPLNGTRLSIEVPKLSVQIQRPNTQPPGSSGPDLSPSLSSLHLDMSARYPNVYSNNKPTLRETRSFFSDDSSAVEKQRGSIRKRLHLHSLRGVLPTSPRATVVSDGADGTSRTNGSRPRQFRGTYRSNSHEQERDLYGTVGMSDFSYRKRKIVERLKDWWKRHSMQRKLGLKRNKSSRSVSTNTDGCGLGV